MPRTTADQVRIGKFDIQATYAQALHRGVDDDQARQRGMVAAIMGAKARLGYPIDGGKHDDDLQAARDAAEKMKK